MPCWGANRYGKIPRVDIFLQPIPGHWCFVTNCNCLNPMTVSVYTLNNSKYKIYLLPVCNLLTRLQIHISQVSASTPNRFQSPSWLRKGVPDSVQQGWQTPHILLLLWQCTCQCRLNPLWLKRAYLEGLQVSANARNISSKLREKLQPQNIPLKLGTPF